MTSPESDPNDAVTTCPKCGSIIESGTEHVRGCRYDGFDARTCNARKKSSDDKEEQLMGTDIHLVVQAKNRDGSWEDVPPPADLDWVDEFDREDGRWWSDRNYDAFAILANVRNGFGVAGVETGDAFVPVVAERRGLPKDFRADSPYDDEKDVGEHSFHWLSLREIVDYPHWDRKRVSVGVVSSEAYARDGLKDRLARVNAPPPDYCGGITGPEIVIVEEAEHLAQGAPVRAKLYVRVTWGETYAYSSGRLYTHFIPSLRRWADERRVSYDDVRLVFGFDS